MPSLRDLLQGLPTFNYYNGGPGNFTQNRIPFGNDRPGGGSSGQPYIVNPEGFRWSPNNADDGLIRFGGIGTVTRTTADVLRITKFFADPVKGQQFIVKQVGLQLCNPMLEQRADKDQPVIGNNLLQRISSLPARINDAFGTTRIYNLGLNTLAQVGVEAIGGHFYRHGLSPVMSDDDKYINIVRDNNNFQNTMVTTDAGNRLVNLTAKLFGDDRLIAQYVGGPGSTYGIVSTTLTSVVDTLSDSKNISDLSDFIPIKPSDLARIDRGGIYLASTGPNANNPNSVNQTDSTTTSPDGSVNYDFNTMDFRYIKNQIYGNAALPFTDYPTLNLANRIGRGNPGTPGLDRTNPSNVLPGTQDLINKLSLFYAKDPPQGSSNLVDLNSGDPVTQESIRDMVKFRMEAIDNDNPAYSVWMVFRAFFQGDIDDTFSAEWNSFKYTGRGERFYTYEGYTRAITMTFVIAAQSRQEMKPLYQKLNYLASTMAPDYNANNKMRGNIIKLTIGDYMYRQPGIITGLNLRIPQDAPWEIAIDEPEGGGDQTMHEIPMIMQVSMTFLPIQNFLPRKGASTPFISVTDRKTPGADSTPGMNNWLADDVPTGKNEDGTQKFTLLEQKISQARKASQTK